MGFGHAVNRLQALEMKFLQSFRKWRRRDKIWTQSIRTDRK